MRNTPLPHGRGSESHRRHDVLAYFITFHTYGTWLHGDEAGSVDRVQNTFATPFLPPDRNRRESEKCLLKHHPVTLSKQCRAIVLKTIRDVANHRGWMIHALNVRTNHVHIVVTADSPAERVIIDLKAYCTRAMRKAGLLSKEEKTWSRHGSTRYLWDEASLASASEYVTEGQGVDLNPIPD